MDYDRVIADLTAWAEGNESVRALVLAGSAASRTSHPLSDRDLEIYTTDPERLLEDESWWSGFGEVLVVERLPNPGWFPTRLVYYVGGKLDFVIAPAAELAARDSDRPFTVLIDKDGQGADLVQDPLSTGLPDAAEFDEALNWAYAAALMTAKAIARDEPWTAKGRDHDLKIELLRVIEWDHRSRYGVGYDTNYLGARLRQWMDQDVQDRLESCWGHFDLGDSTAALRATLDLLSELSIRTAGRLGLPAFDHGRLHREIDRILGSGG